LRRIGHVLYAIELREVPVSKMKKIDIDGMALSALQSGETSVTNKQYAYKESRQLHEVYPWTGPAATGTCTTRETVTVVSTF
jgi:hypothetical protein